MMNVEFVPVLGATSGDTGSAAIHGLRGKAHISIMILHPKDRVAKVQEAQMTSVLDENVHNVAIQGTFDDCQVFWIFSFFVLFFCFIIYLFSRTLISADPREANDIDISVHLYFILCSLRCVAYAGHRENLFCRRDIASGVTLGSSQ
jgi:hypothetical protein